MSPSEYQQLVALLTERFTAVDQRFDRAEAALRELRADVLGHFDELSSRIERLEQEYQGPPGIVAPGMRMRPTCPGSPPSMTRRPLLTTRDRATLRLARRARAR